VMQIHSHSPFRSRKKNGDTQTCGKSFAGGFPANLVTFTIYKQIVCNACIHCIMAILCGENRMTDLEP